MNTQITDMFVRQAVAKGNETWAKFKELSDEQLEGIVGNHIPNPISRTYTRLFVGGTHSLLGRNFDGSYEFNKGYVPTMGEYEIAGKLLEERRE